MIEKLSPSYIKNILQEHLDPDFGSEYWMNYYGKDGYENIEKIDDFDSFRELFALNEEGRKKFEYASRVMPVEAFIPKTVQREKGFIWVSQTGGTTGAAKHGTWGQAYWKHVLDFSIEMMGAHKLDPACNWMFIGPTGPHTTGRWVISLAESCGGKCFTIDLDPRIVKVFEGEGMFDASQRYKKHIWDQVRDIVNSQNIGVIFTTSRLLEDLPEVLGNKNISNLRGVLHAGTKIDTELDAQFYSEVLLGKPLIGVYGTSTTSVSFQKVREEGDDNRVIYVPSCPHVYIDVVDEDGKTVEFGREGILSTYRFTRDSLIPGFWERDRGVRIEPYGAMSDKFAWDWVESPYSPLFETGGQVEGVY